MQDLRVSLFQMELAWENPEANRERFTAAMDKSDPTDLLILPEMFSTGFSMNAEVLAETMDGPTMQWMRFQARQRNAVVCGSLIIREGAGFFNRLVWASPDGAILTYDKRHLFPMTDEHVLFSAGRKRLTTEVNGWRICPFICYDLRFPVWLRNTGNGYDLAVFIANWPASRSAHWRLLLRARAVENLCYVVGVNRVGTDGYGNRYSGHSTAIGFKGEELYEQADIEAIHTIVLQRRALEEYREAFPALKDADAYELKPE